MRASPPTTTFQNDTAYAETWASVALIFWAQRMLNLDCDGKYADMLKLALYNGALAGLSRDGTHYFYENRLESDGSDKRWEWHICPCCTMNVSRLVASVGGYFYATGNDTVAVHLYGGSNARLTVGGTRVGIRQTTDFPWSGRIAIAVDPEAPAEFILRLRIPGWARGETLGVNGVPVDTGTRDRGYIEIRRRWAAGDTVVLELPMPVERVYSHPDVRVNVGRVCLKRGPLVYCVEQADNSVLAIGRLHLPRHASLDPVPGPELFDGVISITAEGKVPTAADWDGDLYRTAPPDNEPARLTAIPYFLWNNRGPAGCWCGYLRNRLGNS
jgi:DUF1680 family protein